MKKLTEWYTSETKPVRVGVYQVAYWDKQHPSFAYWNGSVWGVSCSPISNNSLNWAVEYRVHVNGTQSLPWRGLVK
jgi:hypothetical protein